jgi:hypothetical protein
VGNFMSDTHVSGVFTVWTIVRRSMIWVTSWWIVDNLMRVVSVHSRGVLVVVTRMSILRQILWVLMCG